MSVKPNANGKADANGVRPGDSVPFRKCTEAERDNRVEVLAREMSAHPLATKYELRAFIKRRFKLHWVTCDRYILRARALLRQRSTMSRRQAADLAVNKLAHIIATGTNSEANKALNTWLSIFGLEAPKRHEVAGAGGGPIATADQTAALREVMARMTPARLGELLAMQDRNDGDGKENGA